MPLASDPAALLVHPEPRSSGPARRSLRYEVLGVPIVVSSNSDDVLEVIDGSYAPFAVAPASGDEPLIVEVLRSPDGGTFTVRDAADPERAWRSVDEAVVDGLGRLTALILSSLHDRYRVVAIHAGAVVSPRGAIILAGRSGAGKTTLTLGLVRRGMGLLSDELAVIGTDPGLVLPYARSLHVRPDTVELVPELGFLRARSRRVLGGGSEWAVTPGELAGALPGGLGTPTPLRFVLILDGTPDPGRPAALSPLPRAVAAVELLRSAWKASVDFDGTLDAIAGLVADARCARLEIGALEPTIDTIAGWIEEERGG